MFKKKDFFAPPIEIQNLSTPSLYRRVPTSYSPKLYRRIGHAPEMEIVRQLSTLFIHSCGNEASGLTHWNKLSISSPQFLRPLKLPTPIIAA